jgi:hypothetical protein
VATVWAELVTARVFGNLRGAFLLVVHLTFAELCLPGVFVLLLSGQRFA